MGFEICITTHLNEQNFPQNMKYFGSMKGISEKIR